MFTFICVSKTKSQLTWVFSTFNMCSSSHMLYSYCDQTHKKQEYKIANGF